ncbi:MAG: ABC transporter ATP-binding protein [Gammaproteobacteria bacterium]
MTADTLVETRDVSRYYGEHCAVSDLNLRLVQGDVLGLLGPNGAGKSSTLHMLSGNLAPSTGQISIGGVDLLDSPKQAKSKLGYLPERPPLYLDLTVDEFLGFCAQLHKIASADVSGAVSDVKARCGLGDTGRRLIGNLSKGYQQRVGIAQAIIHRPAVIILDEPTAGLDPIQIHEIRELLRALAADHSVILSTHFLPEVQTVCNRVQIIHEGRTVFADTLESLAQQHSAAATTVVCFDNPPGAETLGTLDGVANVDTLGHGRFRLHHEGNDVADGITQAAVANRWGLNELIPEHNSLEQIFMELVHSEEAAS